MDPVTAVANVVKAWLEFLCTPEGQKLCELNREAVAKVITRIDALMDHAAK